MQPVLPTKDEWTTCDYELGAKRMQDVQEGKVSFTHFYSDSGPSGIHNVQWRYH